MHERSCRLKACDFIARRNAPGTGPAKSPLEPGWSEEDRFGVPSLHPGSRGWAERNPPQAVACPLAGRAWAVELQAFSEQEKGRKIVRAPKRPQILAFLA